MRQRLSFAWIVVGTLVVFGGVWAVQRSLLAAGGLGASLPYVAHAAGALVAGAVLGIRAPALRPWREPAIAGALGVGVFAVCFLVLPYPLARWGAVPVDAPYLGTLVLAAGSAACAGAGAIVARRVLPGRPGVASLLVFSACVIVASFMIPSLVSVGLRGDHGGPVASVIGGIFVGGAITQAMTPVRNLVACGGGASLWLVLVMIEEGSRRGLTAAIGGGFALMLIGVLGAAVGWRLTGHRHGPAVPDVPTARAS